MKRSTCFALSLLGLTFVIVIAGCGGGGAAAPAITLLVAPATASVQAGATQQFTATVANDSSNKGVTWSVAGTGCTGSACGTLTNSTPTSVTYNAPASVSANLTVTVRATSATDSTKSASATVVVSFVSPTSLLTITTTSLPNGTLNVPYSQTLQSSGGTPPVTWSLGGTLPAGLSLNSSGTISGTPTEEGTSGFVVIATDSTTPTPQQPVTELSIAIGPVGANDSLLNGHYALLLSGFTGRRAFENAGAPVAVAGSFVADGKGNLTSGVFDTNKTGGVMANQPFTGTYSIGPDNRGTMTITGSQQTFGFAFAVGSISSGVATKGRIIEFDTPGVGIDAGEFDRQDTTAFSISVISGLYAFGLSGRGLIQGQFGADGVFAADGTGKIASGNLDANQAGAMSTDVSFSGTYSVPSGSSTGRGTATFTGGLPSPNLVFYVVSANKLLLISTDPAVNPEVFSGQALKQSGEPFTNGSLKGVSVFDIVGFDSAVPGADVAAGLATFDGTSAISMLEDQNDAGTVKADTMTSASYGVSSNGRVTFMGLTNPPVLYLVSTNQGFMLTTDSHVGTGFFEPQLAGAFKNSSINGNFFFGALPPAPLCCGTLSSGVATLNNGAINGTKDINGFMDFNVAIQTSTAFSDTYSASSNGRATTGSGTSAIYIVSPTKFVIIDVNPSDTQPRIEAAQQ